ncbi:hypothetical protein [Streptomyces sp. bgisy032]|uniref:hypothetical protein n=1 Tax=Streptomyces sp. bgisy032 TaxID=3413773 RepID=UPI003D7523D7
MSVTLCAFVPSATSFGWVWALWKGDNPLATEQLKSLAELPNVLRTYTTMVGAILRLKDAGDRFNVTAYDAESGSVYGRDQWLWDPYGGLYRPHGNPWVPMEEARQDLSQRAPMLPLVTPLPDPSRSAQLAA